MTGPLFPTNLTRVWLTGTFIDLGGNPKTGEVVLTPSPAVLLDRTPKLIISGRVFRASTDPITGVFQMQVPCTDDPDITPVDWTYAVVDPAGRSYNIDVSIDTPLLDQPGHPLHGQQVIDLIDVVPAPAPQSGTVQLLSGRGIASTSLDDSNHLIVTYTDGTSHDAGNVGGSSGGATETFVDDAIADHVAADEPHPVYDDIPSLTLIFESRLI